MRVQPQADRLTVLRSNLRRVEEEYPDEELSPAALDLKRLLLHRIANIEAAMKSLNDILQKHHATGTVPDKGD